MESDPHIKGYYLGVDVAHDFNTINPQGVTYNHGGPEANKRVPPIGTNPGLDEDVAVDYIENKAVNNVNGEFIKDGKARRSKRIIFTIPTKTATFKESSVPRLFGAGNDKIGIVQDAGKFITPYLGAKNVLTFGSILDPAGKPVSKEDAPIWFKPAADTGITIPLGPFGFDVSKIQAIKVFNLTAGTVSSSFVMPDGSEIDAVTMKPISQGQRPTGLKPINNTEIEKAGFYTSIEKANEIENNAYAKSANIPPARKFLFNVGKTLGDLTLVASCMSGFQGGTPNIYYGIGQRPSPARDAPGWQSWFDKEPATPPSVLVLKTGDRLNALRAHMENVPNILEQQAGKGRAVKQFVFTPGDADPGAIFEAVKQGYAELISNVTNRYDKLIQNFRACLKPSDGSLLPNFTIFTENPTIPPGDAAGLRAAGVVIQEIIACLENLKAGIVGWLNARAEQSVLGGIGNIEASQTAYNSDVETSTHVSPQTTDVVYTKGGTTKVMLKIIVSQLPKAIPAGFTCPLQVSLDISLWNAFSRLKGGGGIKGLDSLYGTDLHKRFIVPVSQIPGFLNAATTPNFIGLTQQQGGALTPQERAQIEAQSAWEEESLLQNFVDVNTRHDSDEKPTGPSSKRARLRGGVITIGIEHKRLDEEYPEWENLYDTFPLISQFGSYMTETLQINERKELLLACYSVFLGKDSGTIIDNVFLGEFLREFERMYATTDYNPEPLVSFKGAKQVRVGTSTGGIDMFNAFICRTNFENALEFGFIADIPVIPDDIETPQTQPVIGTDADAVDSAGTIFGRLEQKFIEKADLDTISTGGRDGAPLNKRFKVGAIQANNNVEEIILPTPAPAPAFNPVGLVPLGPGFFGGPPAGQGAFGFGGPPAGQGAFGFGGPPAAPGKPRKALPGPSGTNSYRGLAAQSAYGPSFYDASMGAKLNEEYDDLDGGGSRVRRPLYSNVQASKPLQSKSRTHSRLRERAKTRRARGVRKSARKSKTRR